VAPNGLKDLVKTRADAAGIGGFPKGRVPTLLAGIGLLIGRSTLAVEVSHGLTGACVGDALEVVVGHVADPENVGSNTRRVGSLRGVVRLRDAALIVERHAGVVRQAIGDQD